MVSCDTVPRLAPGPPLRRRAVICWGDHQPCRSATTRAHSTAGPAWWAWAERAGCARVEPPPADTGPAPAVGRHLPAHRRRRPAHLGADTPKRPALLQPQADLHPLIQAERLPVSTSVFPTDHPAQGLATRSAPYPWRSSTRRKSGDTTTLLMPSASPPGATPA